MTIKEYNYYKVQIGISLQKRYLKQMKLIYLLYWCRLCRWSDNVRDCTEKINIKVMLYLTAQRIVDWNDKDLTKLPPMNLDLMRLLKWLVDATGFFTEVDKAIDEEHFYQQSPTKTYESRCMVADLKYVELSARQIAKVATTDKIVVEKSTLLSKL